MNDVFPIIPTRVYIEIGKEQEREYRKEEKKKNREY